MRRTASLFILLLCMPLILAAQNAFRLNYGVKGGFGTVLYTIQELSVSGHAIAVFESRTDVSGQGAIFVRLNRNRHYLQTECAWSSSRYTVQFSSEDVYDYARPSDISSISTQLQNIEVPLIYGYHLIQQEGCGIALFAGPEICCILPSRSSLTFTNFTHQSVSETVRPITSAVTAGFTIHIRRLFFETCAEAGLSNISRHFSSTSQNGAVSSTDIVFNRRKNGIYCSLGFMF